MSKTNNLTTGGATELKTAQTVEQAFQALPPIGSDAYIEHVSKAATRELPPEVLARALRQLPPTSAAYDATLARLLGRKGKGWEYFGLLVAKARRMVVGPHDHDDVFQDAFTRILQVLPTKRGELSERAWNAFCLREAKDAWRARFGRRGERLPKEQAIGAEESIGDKEGESPDDVFEVEVLPPWHVKICDGNNERIEQIARMVIEKMPDGFVREVATRAWFENMRPKISGTAKPGAVPLTDLFPGKSRHQIQRALRHADSQLAAALLAHEKIDWNEDELPFLEERRDPRPRAVRKEEGNEIRFES